MNSTIQAVLDASMPNKETFMSPYYRNLTIVLITLLITQLLVIFIGKFLWNLILPGLFSFVKPAKSIWEIWALQILLKLIIG